MLQVLGRVGLVTGPELDKELKSPQPSIQDRVNVKVGFYVQLLLRAESSVEPQFRLTERMWVKVTHKKGIDFTGIIVNQPHVLVDYFSRGSELRFSAEHIIDIEKPKAELKLS